MKKNIDIFHLFHSGVAVDNGNKVFVFDYYRDNFDGKLDKIIPDIKEKEGVYVFVSHQHFDHYNKKIFDWKQYNDNINYILSDDIVRTENYSNIIYVKKDQKLEIDDIKIKTLGSTDAGVSFLVITRGISMFHAGDLNWWHWESFSERKLKKEEQDFKNEIKKLKDKKVNIAFIPVDPRLGEYYYLAGKYFATEIKPDYIVPIHFSDQYLITEKFKKKIKDMETEAIIVEENKKISVD